MSAQIQNCIHEDPQNSLKYGAECALEVWPRQWAQFCFAKHRQSSHQPPASLYHYWTFQSWVAWRRIQFATVAQETQRKQTIWHIQPAHPMELLGCEVSYYTEFHSFWIINAFTFQRSPRWSSNQIHHPPESRRLIWKFILLCWLSDSFETRFAFLYPEVRDHHS